MTLDTALKIMDLCPYIFISALLLWMLILGYFQPENMAFLFAIAIPTLGFIYLQLCRYTDYLIDKEFKDESNKFIKN